MKKMIAVLSLTFLIAVLSGVAIADEPINTDVLDRHAVWTKKFEESSKSSHSETKQTSTESADAKDNVTMKVRIEDRPWARVG